MTYKENFNVSLLSHRNKIRQPWRSYAGATQFVESPGSRVTVCLTYTNAGTPIQLNGYAYLANSILLSGLKF